MFFRNLSELIWNVVSIFFCKVTLKLSILDDVAARMEECRNKAKRTGERRHRQAVVYS